MFRALILTYLFLLPLTMTVQGESVSAAGDRERDTQLIRDHIDSIFQAYADKDAPRVRATHSEHWRGFLRSSPTILKGVDEYMAFANVGLRSPGGLTGYEMLEFDVVFYGDDLAVVPYVADMFVAQGDQSGAIKIRALDVYARLEGEWIQVASNTANHPESEGLFRFAFPNEKQSILEAQEAVWRAYFANDQIALQALLPEGTIALPAEEKGWKETPEILTAASDLARRGAKLVRLEFPETEVQMYGRNTAVVYTTYALELEIQGERQDLSGRGTEIFSFQDGRWKNTGWHLDRED
ncbi:MAG: nuclear transport factor 2 family protein [Deltaproteobacteria bacterium]|nr:nuclear transport factor 2 family protein [Deltaproteobacteria bacterium]